MTRERALEILELGSQYCNYSDKMNDQEIFEVKALWDTMPGYTCFYDALCRFAYPGVEVKA